MKKYKNIILILAAVAVTLAAFIFAPKGVEYSGTDDAAEKTISTIQKDYEPWFSPSRSRSRKSALYPARQYRSGDHLLCHWLPQREKTRPTKGSF